MSESRSLRVRCFAVIFGLALLAAGCGGEAEDAAPAVTVSRTSTPVTTIATTTESTTTTTTEPTTTTEESEGDDPEEVEEETTTTTETPTTLAFADDNSSSGDTNSGGAETATATTAASGVDTTVAGDGTAAETTTTIATTTTIDPFAPLVDFEEIVVPHGDAVTSVTVNAVNLKCDSNGVSPQLDVFAPYDLSNADQLVTFYGPSGASYIVSGQVGTGLATFTSWATDPVVADSFDWVAICSQPSWKVLIELSDEAGGLFSVVVDASISG